jgi:hypothetical protein
MTLRTASRLALWLGLLSLLAMLLANLALIDIYHGEQDVTLEWNFVRMAFLVMLAFHAVALTAAWLGYKEPGNPGQQAQGRSRPL